LLRRTGIFILSIDLLLLRRLIFDLMSRSGRRISRNSDVEGLVYVHNLMNRRQKEDPVKTRFYPEIFETEHLFLAIVSSMRYRCSYHYTPKPRQVLVIRLGNLTPLLLSDIRVRSSFPSYNSK
jgi:hypothetical protein